MVCILLTSSGMWERNGYNARKTRQVFAGFMGLAFLALSAAPACAQDALSPPHVRPESDLRRLVDDAARRSPAIQEWIDRLEELDVTVYIRTKLFVQPDLEGRVALLSAAGSHRYLIIELACGRAEITQMSILGHELFHAIEIAEEPTVVDAATLADLYLRIGSRTSDRKGLQTFETDAAAAAGQQARRQLLSSTTRHGHGT